MIVALVVSPDLSFRQSIRHMLEGEYSILTSQNLRNSFEIIRSGAVDILIVDTVSEKEVIPTLIQDVKALSPTLTILLVVETVNGGKGKTLREAGADEVIGKPVDREILLQILGYFQRLTFMQEEIQSLRSQVATHHQIVRPPSGREHAEIESRTDFFRYRDSLSKFSRAISAIDEKDKMLTTLVDAVQDIFSVNRVAILMKEAKEDYFDARTTVGINADLISQYRFASTRGLVGFLFSERRPVLRSRIRTGEQDPQASSVAKEMDLLGAEVAVPLFRDGHEIGALALGGRFFDTEFSQEDMEHLVVLARYASMAILNCQLLASRTADSRLLGRMADALDVGILAIDGQGDVLYINEKGESLLGSPSEVIFENSIQKVSSVFADLLLKAVRHDETVHNLSVQERTTREVFSVTTGLMVDDRQGKIAVLLFHRLSDQEEEPSVRRGERVDWNEIAEGIAHEVKNPLVSIRTYSQLLPEKYNDITFREEFSQVVRQQVDKLDSFVEELVAYAEPVAFHMKWSDIHTPLNAALASFTNRLADLHIHVVSEFEKSPIESWFDDSQMTAAFSKILENVITAMPDGGKLEIVTGASEQVLPEPPEWKTKPEGGTTNGGNGHETVSEHKTPAFRILFIHTGLAPDTSSRNSVFQPFGVRWPAGSSLSLPNAHRIVRQHGGRIQFHEQRGGGAAIEVILPARESLVS